MAFVAGKNTAVLVAEYDLTGFLNQASVSKASQVVKTTVFGLDDETYMAGIEEGSSSAGGLYDGAAAAVDAAFTAALTGGTPLVVTVAWPGYDTIGNACGMLQAYEASYQIRGAVNDAVRINATFTGDKGARFGQIIHPLVQRSTPANYASIDAGASTASGAVAQLHVTEFTGTDATIKVTDSTDDAVFADLITFTQVAGITSERGTATGTVNRYARVELTGTFTTITFAVSFVRGLHT